MNYLYIDDKVQCSEQFSSLAARLLALPECLDYSAQDVLGSDDSSGISHQDRGGILVTVDAADKQIVLKDLSTGTEQLLDFGVLEFSRRLVMNNLSREYLVRSVIGRRKQKSPLYVLDTTGGFGRDAMLLAAAGCKVVSLERSPALSMMVADSVCGTRLHANAVLSDAAKRLECVAVDSIVAMPNWQRQVPDVIYIDPMYKDDAASDRSTSKSGVKKYMALLRRLNDIYEIHYAHLLSDIDSDSVLREGASLLDAARNLARLKVVVKRSPNAPDLNGVKPTSRLVGKAARFDVYAV